MQIPPAMLFSPLSKLSFPSLLVLSKCFPTPSPSLLPSLPPSLPHRQSNDLSHGFAVGARVCRRGHMAQTVVYLTVVIPGLPGVFSRVLREEGKEGEKERRREEEKW